MRTRSFLTSCAHALCGLRHGTRTERHLRVHLTAFVVVVTLGCMAHVSRLEWAVLLFASGLVIVTELVNTAIERTVNLLARGRYRATARMAKDLAASAVLVSCCVAVAVGLCVLGPTAWQVAKHMAGTVLALRWPEVAALVTAAASVVLVWRDRYRQGHIRPLPATVCLVSMLIWLVV